ncbi:MAG: DUF3568 family protein [Candidatus Scalindua rubra]|uniref:AsmA-like C-terminal domain-containing protein n=1 Tax=Candidatus Scalindua brodae TaxID=237368 RepID=A0A0B0EGY1_9BACT|nr:MAG: hypothetical protein SCABRO_02435 [Candidatus Scalindua brodae]MBZ0107623.1 DUF3568 family protein [Candidatus Scalindua rubra]
MKKIVILPTSIVLGLIVLLVILITVKDRIIKSAIEIASKQVMGVETVIDRFSLSVIKQSVSIKGLRLYQPESFSEGVFVDITEVSGSCKIASLLGKKIHIPKLSLNIKEVILVKDKYGNLNVDALKIAREEGRKLQDEKTKMAFQIDEMILTIDKVIYKQYSQDGKPIIKAFDIGIKDEKYENITSPQQFAGKILQTVLESMAARAGLKSSAIYGIAAITGIGTIPVAAGAILFGKDHAIAEFDQDFQTVYDACIATLRKLGEVSKENGIIKGKASGCSISIELTKTKQDKTQVKVSGRKLFWPKPKIAGGILHEITQNLKKKEGRVVS